MRAFRSQAPVSLSETSQRGFSLIGFLCTLIVLGTAGLLLLRAGPSVLEYWAVEKAIVASSAVASSPADVRAAFDKLASAGFIDAIEGKDLQIEGHGKEMQVSFAYQKKIALVGPASLLIDYKGSTANTTSDSSAK